METGVNHLDFISSYSPIGDDEQGHYSAKPEYYGMLAFSLAGKGKLLNVDVGANSGKVKAYATHFNPDALALTLINKGSQTASCIMNASSQIQGRQASVLRLSGPAVDAKSGITLGGAEVTSPGTWKPAKSERIPLEKGQLRIDLAAASAAIVKIGA